MVRLITLLSGLFLLLALYSGCSKTSAPEPPDETFYIDLSPDSLTADMGDTVTLTGSINSVENLFAISFDLVYDTSIVEFLSVSIPQNSILGQNSLTFSNHIDDGVSVSLGRIQTSGNDNISASGLLYEARFEALSTGSTEIQYRNIHIIDETGTENAELGMLQASGAGVTIQ